MSKPHVKRASRLEDIDGHGLVPGDRVGITYGDDVIEGVLTVEETYVIRLDRPASGGTVTETLRHDPQGRLARLQGRKVAA